MTKRLKIATALAIAALTGLYLWHRATPSEPVWGGHPVSYWADELAQPSTNRQQAAEAFHQLKVSALPVLVSRLFTQSGLWRRQYERMWPKLPQSIKSRLHEPLSESRRRIGAILAIQEIGPEARSAAPALIDALRSAQRHPPFGNNAAPTAATLMNMNGSVVLVGGSFTNRVVVASVSGSGVVPANLQTLPAISVLLGIGERQEMAMDAMSALAAVESGDRDTFRALLDSLRDKAVAGSATVAIQRIVNAKPSNIGPLVAALREWNYVPMPGELSALRRAIDLLDPMVKDNPQVQTFMVKLLGDADPKVRADAAKSLRNAALTSPEIFCALCAAAADSDATVRTEATDVIVLGERRYREFWALLLGAAKDPRVPVRVGVAEILGQLGEPARRALPYTKGMLKDPDAAVRARAATAIGKLGSWGKDAVAELQSVAADADPEVRKAALNALAAVEK